ncbi:hypothetical protein [Frigoribacterium sp. RIT-PI-h]|uniref:hypothetical protein n=1 Tax=Frigoribacterium sp. RIT-PI-h TaxID=1690245 RepID=UPI00128FB9EB|nr:hypothetical protein [Frigoribacterium sp. RIT-PI-h]
MADLPSMETLAELSTHWGQRWSPAPPGSVEDYRFGSGVLLEFDRLPTLHQHAEQAMQYAEIIFRDLTLLRALKQGATDASVFVSTFAWSRGPEPGDRDSWLKRFFPARLWHSDISATWMADPDCPEELPIYEHAYVTQLGLDDPGLAAALALSSGMDGESLAIYPSDASWVFTLKEDGAFVRTDGDRAAELVAQFPEWVGRATRVRPSNARLEDQRDWQIDFSYLDERTASRILDMAETQGLLEWPAGGRLVDPRDDHMLALSREQGQRLRVLATDAPGLVVDDFTGEGREMTPAMVREEIEEGQDPLAGLDEFIDEEAYRHPAEAKDGHLPKRFWSPRHSYDGIDGSDLAST